MTLGERRRRSAWTSQGHTTIHTHIHTYRQFKVDNAPNASLPVLGRWKEVGENPEDRSCKLHMDGSVIRFQALTESPDGRCVSSSFHSPTMECQVSLSNCESVSAVNPHLLCVCSLSCRFQWMGFNQRFSSLSLCL